MIHAILHPTDRATHIHAISHPLGWLFNRGTNAPFQNCVGIVSFVDREVKGPAER